MQHFRFILLPLLMTSSVLTGCVAYPVYTSNPVVVNPTPTYYQPTVVVSQPVYQPAPPVVYSPPVYYTPPAPVYPVYVNPYRHSHGSVYYNNSKVSVGIRW